MCACEFTPALGLTQPTVSHHLKKLTETGLLEREQRGKWAYFSLNAARSSSWRASFESRRSSHEHRVRRALREQVRERYAQAARAVGTGSSASCGDGSCCDGKATDFGEALYSADQRGELPDAAVLASLGCGNPTAVADLREGETCSTSARAAGST